MSNSTKQGYHNIHGVNPQALIEKVIRSRIYESPYWKEHCFALSADTLIDQAVSLHSIGGVYANQRPTEFLCLTLKLLQLQPDKEILIEYLTAQEFKYLRALAAFYVRLTFRPVEVYEVLEPLLQDYRKLRYRDEDGYSLVHFDAFIDELLTSDRACDVILPRLTQRSVLEETEGLGPRRSALDGSVGQGRREEEDEEEEEGERERQGKTDMQVDDDDDDDDDKGRFISRSPSPRLSGSSRSRSRSRSSSATSSWRSRSRSISPDRLERLMAAAVGEARWRSAAAYPTTGGVDELGLAGEGGVEGERIEGDV